MKAVVFSAYGSLDGLHLVDVEKPVPGDNEALIKVHAASINDWDWAIIQGVPFVNRMETGLFKPKKRMLGTDVAGTVEATGRNVTRFRPGDAVFGDICRSGWKDIPAYNGGAYAEYVCTTEDTLLPKPAGMSFEQAASLPQVGGLVVQGLRRCGGVQAGQNVLVNGASGGVGTLAVQIARSLGADVTGVCSTGKMEMVRSLGADHVIDYTKEDFTRNGNRYDFILDAKGFHSIFDYRRALAPNGCYAMLGGGNRSTTQMMMFGWLVSLTGSRKLGLVIYRPNRGLDYLLELVEAGSVSPVIDSVFPLSETADAFRYYVDGKAKGKIVITVASET